MARIGDNWRLRYRGLKLHNKTPVNHLRYLPFPSTFPEYIPKDKIANWLESYVDIMEVDFWTRTAFDGADYDEAAQRWTARLTREGVARTLRPKHIVLATSVSGTPNIPDIEGIDNFKGEVLHSSRFKAGREWKGRPVIVFGTGTSAHDICQELQAAGADVTMVQRSPTMVVNVEPAQLYDKTYLGDGPPIASRDILNSGVPLPVMKLAHKLVTDEVKRIDAPLLTRLEAAGFRLELWRGRHRLAAEVSHPRRRLLFQRRRLRADRRRQDQADPGGRYRSLCRRRHPAARRHHAQGRSVRARHRLQGAGSSAHPVVRRGCRQARRPRLGF